MRLGPIQTEDRAPAAPMLRGMPRALAGHQGLSIPAGRKHGGRHRPARRSGLARPDVHVVEPVQGRVRTEQHAGHRATEVFKTCLAAEDVALGSQPAAYRLWHSHKR
jgi:hypothetical protein